MKVLKLIGILIFTGSFFPKQYLPAADLSDLEIWDIWDEENNKPAILGLIVAIAGQQEH